MNVIAFDDINAAQLRKLAHTRAAVRGEPRTPTLGRVGLAANFDRLCGTQYRLDLLVSERLRFAHSDFLRHLHAPASERVTPERKSVAVAARDTASRRGS